MLDWNPALYSRFEDERTRPARELLARVPLDAPAHVVDLGCGPGNSTELLAARYPRAQLVGLDSSETMLASARKRLPGVDFVKGDIAHWAPSTAPNLLYANASLQWVAEHETLIPRLFASLAPGGVLAIQMPDNRAEPSHRLMREVAAMAPWQSTIASSGQQRTALLNVGTYYDLLAPLAATVDVWHTIYQHPMASAQAIVEWVSATGLRPYVDPLPEPLRAGFLAEYTQRVAQAYLPHADGQRLLSFPRMFIVAQRPS